MDRETETRKRRRPPARGESSCAGRATPGAVSPRTTPWTSLHRYDVLVDGSDNFPTRFLTNDTAFLLKKPLVYGAIHRFEGQTGVFAPHLGGPCYRCLLPNMPAPGSVPSCQEAGVLGVLPGIIGSFQAMETIKLILGIGTVPLGKLTCYDALHSAFRVAQAEPRSALPSVWRSSGNHQRLESRNHRLHLLRIHSRTHGIHHHRRTPRPS